MRRSLAVVVMWIAGACTGGRGASDTSFLPVAPNKLAPHAGEDVRVLHVETHVRFELDADGASPIAVTTERRQDQIFTQRGQQHTEVFTGYSQTFETVEHFSARVVAPNGDTVRAWGRDQVIDSPAFPDFVLYSDSRVIGVDVPDTPAGSVVERVIVKRMKSPQLFALGHGFEEEHPVMKSRFIVDVPQGFTIEHVSDRANVETKFAPTTEPLPNGGTRYTWERTALSALVEEPLSPELGALREQVAMRLASWTDATGKVHEAAKDPAALSRFTYSLMKDQEQITPALEAHVKTVLTGVKDEPRAKAARLYAWTRDSIRYCAVSVGMGGWVPHASVEVEQQRYGDCKDKANLLKSMLRVAGIESRLVTIFSSPFPIRFRLPVLSGNFNHAILIVDLPAGPVWVDPTTRTTPFDDLPPDDEDRLALPISPQGDPLTPAPESRPDRERTTTSAELTLDSEGVARGTFTIEVNGAFADHVRGELLEKPQVRHAEVIAAALPLNHAKIAKFSVEHAAPPEEVTPLTSRGDVEARVTTSLKPGSDVLLSARTVLKSVIPVLRRDRKAPVLLGFRRARVESARIVLPKGASVSRLPPPFTVDTPHASYALTWSTEPDGALKVSRSFTVKVRTVPLEEIGAFVDAAERAAAAEEQKVVVRVEGT